MAGRGKAQGSGVTVIVRQEEGGDAGHHGGAWKVAYADFVTAMMAFFLLMWLINATSEEQRRGLADYFAPSNVMARGTSGTGEPFGGRTPNADGAAVSDNGAKRIEFGAAPVQMDLEEEGEAPPEGPTDAATPARPAIPATAQEAGAEPGRPGSGGAANAEAAADAEPLPRTDTAAIPDVRLRAELARREKLAFERAAEDLRAAVRDDPDLADLARQLVVEQVPEGLRIQILDNERRPMFPTGGVAPNDRARVLLQKVVGIVARLPNALAIAGHTDATPFRGPDRSNWELSADRANAARRILADAGIAEQRLSSVTGHAERELLLPQDPTNPANRRVAITLLRALPESAIR